MVRELTREDARDAVLGGSVLACGGGGWASHGEMMGELATGLGTPLLVGLDELDDEDLTATVTAIGAPAAPDWEIRPLDYVHALQRLMEQAPGEIVAVLTAQNGASTTLNGWIQSVILGVKVLDAAGDVRAHPTGKLGSLGLATRGDLDTVQAVYGGNRARHGTLDLAVKGRVTTTDDVLRDVSVRSGGFIAAARHPLPASWIREHAALGAISYALDLGAAMRHGGEQGSSAVIDAACAHTGGSVLATGPARIVDPLRTQGGFDHGTYAVGEVTLRFLNEYMTADADGQRIATYPDVLATLSVDDGLPVAIGDVEAGRELAVIHIPKQNLPLSSSNRDVVALREVEQIMDLQLVAYGSPEPDGDGSEGEQAGVSS